MLPTGFVKVRYFGFLSPNCAAPIEQVRARIEMAHGFALAPASIKVTAREPMRVLPVMQTATRRVPTSGP